MCLISWQSLAIDFHVIPAVPHHCKHIDHMCLSAMISDPNCLFAWVLPMSPSKFFKINFWNGHSSTQQWQNWRGCSLQKEQAWRSQRYTKPRQFQLAWICLGLLWARNKQSALLHLLELSRISRLKKREYFKPWIAGADFFEQVGFVVWTSKTTHYRDLSKETSELKRKFSAI